MWFFFFQAEDGIRDSSVTGVQTCALPISSSGPPRKVPTPGKRTIGEVSAFLGIPPGLLFKTLLFETDKGDVAVVLSGRTEANEEDAPRVDVVPGRDFSPESYADLRLVEEGDRCPRCPGSLRFSRGIEVGHVFRLGTKYSKALSATYLDSGGKEKPVVMGGYGIGVGRTAAAAIEQHHDAAGIIWPILIG